MQDRFSSTHLDAWRRDGGVVIENFFTPAEVAAVCADFERVFDRKEGGASGVSIKTGGEIGRFNTAQFATLDSGPFECSPALNLIGVHPALVAFAQQALGAADVYLYQCQAWAKFTGDADYDQPFHCDFVNHTLTVPAEAATPSAITILCYFTDVSEAHGPAHYVTRPDSLAIGGPELTLSQDREVQARLQGALKERSRSTAAPAGSVFPYSIDVYHRGTNMTAPGGRRFAVMACFRAAHDDTIGFHAWQFHHLKPWRHIFENATPAQLACYGVPKPGHPFWTGETLRRAQVRYPGWDMSAYREALQR